MIVHVVDVVGIAIAPFLVRVHVVGRGRRQLLVDDQVVADERAHVHVGEALAEERARIEC